MLWTKNVSEMVSVFMNGLSLGLGRSLFVFFRCCFMSVVVLLTCHESAWRPVDLTGEK